MKIMIAIICFTALGGGLGGLLGWAARSLKVEGDPRVDEINDLLPGGQCGQCGEAGCKQAAEAMVVGKLPADCCPPGGRSLALSIASILGIPLDTGKEEVALVAVINEELCNGCTRCFKACPFDAIVGANRQMHTVISAVCTGCRLCEKACNQGCLTLDPITTEFNTWLWPKPKVA
jgi:electron transport complex protein RnfB